MKLNIESQTWTPIEQFEDAVRAADATRVRALLTQHADVRAAIGEPHFDLDSPALHQAKRYLDVVDVLLEFDADIDARSRFWAAGSGSWSGA